LKILKRLGWLAAAALWLAFLFYGAGPLPALGPMFEVSRGIWQHERVQLGDRVLRGLQAPVMVAYDSSGVPHFFADSAADLFLAQGYVTASQRLFQLDVYTRQTAGRLTELFGSKALPYDEFFTRFGMREAARATWEAYAEDPAIKTMVESYAAGVNAWIGGLTDLPAEYKILGARPEAFSPMKVMNMGKALTWSLSGRSFDPQLTAYLQALGAEKVLDLFPEFVPAKYEDFVMPGHPKNPHAPEKPELFSFVSALKNVPHFPLPNPGRGSNNWVIGPAKSTTGTSVLANDTHLNLSLPSTWYENQLSCPEFNVYGVSLAAIPGIVNGFNKDVAWGPTNGTTDVMDFFEIEFENETSLRYKWNGGWEEAKVIPEKIAFKHYGFENADVIETKLGPLLHREGKLGLAVDWTGYRPGRELRALRAQMTAQSAADCIDGFRDWLSPIQNFVCADKTSIGWIHAGFVPRREVGDGRFFMDGRGSKGRLITPVERVPQSLNPKQGFLLSANQKIAPPGYSDYLGWDYEPPFRGMTIRRFLTAKEKLSPEDMMNLQNENLDLQAEMALPFLLRHVSEGGDAVWLERLRKWDFRIRAAQAEGAVFKAWWAALKEKLFADELGENAKWLLPKDARVLWMLERLEANPGDPDVRWVDDVTTADHAERLDEIVTAAFDEALRRTESAQGKNEAHWSWKNFNQTRFTHAGRLPGFGTGVLAMNGSTETVRGLGGNHGAVYKAVIVTGDWPEAWMQVPGGNEGDPFSPDYERFVGDWVEGKMRKVEFYHDREEAKAKAARVIFLKPEGTP
jgi:penicillin amidase